MISLWTAVPGSGKTLSAIAVILKAIAEKRMVFTNISGLQKELIDPSGLYLHDAPDDWRDTPEGSLVIYDECQQPHLYPSNAKAGKVEDERLTAMETHRHTGHDLIFITQAPTFVHHHIRKLVGEHMHLYRAMGVKGANKYTWSHTCDNPNDRKEQERADSSYWLFPKEHFKYYKSATVHTHKFKIPRKMYFFGFLIVCVSAFIYSMYSKNNGISFLNNMQKQAGSGGAKAEVPAPASPPASHTVSSNVIKPDIERIYGFSAVEEAIPVMGYVSYQNKCMVFSRNGVTLELPNGQCKSAIGSPVPRAIESNRSGRT